MTELIERQQRLLEKMQTQITELNATIGGLRSEQASLRAEVDALRNGSSKSNDEAASAKVTADRAEFADAEAKTGVQFAKEDAVAVQKKMTESASLLQRFRWTGDIRVRGESIFQDLSPDRNRARLRVRVGLEGKTGEDFYSGFALATGAFDEPVSTNNTLTGFFNRKIIAVDKGWITYQPQNHKWLQLTGGKWAYTWLRTSLTFDPDLNPEGFSEKLSFDFQNPILKNVSATGIQLLYNEVLGSITPTIPGSDSFAAGGQVSATLRFGNRVTTTFAGAALNWQNADSITQAITARTLAGNRNTNATVGAGANIRYASQFLYVDSIADTTITTPNPKLPVRVTLDFVHNARARTSQADGFWGDLLVGRSREKHDLQLGYSFGRIEQDAVLAPFNESEMRAPTNVLQHKVLAQWLCSPNTTLSFTGWFGRTLDRNLQNAALPTGLPGNEQDPETRRFQFDVIYRF